VMLGNRPARLLLPGDEVRLRAKAPRTSLPDEELDEGQRALFESLRAHRLEIAQQEGVPAYVVASDRTLRDLARLQPGSLNELLDAHGIGPAKAERYGAGFLDVIRAAP